MIAELLVAMITVFILAVATAVVEELVRSRRERKDSSQSPSRS
jgi:hypothetical protein